MNTVNNVEFKIVSYNNKSRKGDYYYSTYKDYNGKTKTAQIKVNSMSVSEFVSYVRNVKEIKGTKNKRKFSVNYKKDLKLRKSKIKKSKKKSKEFKRLVKNYDVEREKTKNALIFDRNSFKTPELYESQERVIIIRAGGNGLSSMSEEMFRNKLYSYMGRPKNRLETLFLEDIINKWGSEFKR